MHEHALREAASAWWRAGRPAVVVEVVAHQGSVPRETGTRMVVSAQAVLGTIGGGHLEWQAVARARELLRDATQGPGAAPRVQRIALGPSLGQCCGGAVTLRWQPLHEAPPASWSAPAARFHLQLFGAGHVGRAIVALLAGVPCTVHWVDEREAEFPGGPVPPHVQVSAVDAVVGEVALAPAGSCVLVLTHSHALDLELAQAVLARGTFGFFGLIGSRTKRARFERRLIERGVPASQVARMVCPIGVPGIRGKEPEVLAIAVVAQLLQHAGGAPAAASPAAGA